MRALFVAVILTVTATVVHAQQTDTATAAERDSIYIHEVQETSEPDKVLHAEPLYIDLIRDLGARKGEAEWNVAFDLTDRLTFDRYGILVEYEWAPVDRLGLEIEIPVTLYSRLPNGRDTQRPSNRIESIKTAMQWTFLVRQREALSAAFGYINELEFSDLNDITRGPIFSGNVVNPFLIVAKRWTDNVHSLLYTGPRTTIHFDDGSISTTYQVNLSGHYMIMGTRNFVGLEVNAVYGQQWTAVMRPQMRLGVTHDVLLGIGMGIPIRRDQERLGMFMRLIWEPG